MVTFTVSNKTFVILNIKTALILVLLLLLITKDKYFYLTSDSARLNTKVLPSDAAALN